MAQIKELEIRTAIREVHRFQNIIIKLTQEKDDLKKEEDAIHHRYAQQRDELHELEMSELRERRTNVGMQLEVVKAGTVSRRIPRAPKFTPVIRCFLKHPFIVEEHDVGECYLSLPRPTQIESGFSSNNIGALAAFNPAHSLLTN